MDLSQTSSSATGPPSGFPSSHPPIEVVIVRSMGRWHHGDVANRVSNCDGKAHEMASDLSHGRERAGREIFSMKTTV